MQIIKMSYFSFGVNNNVDSGICLKPIVPKDEEETRHTTRYYNNVQ